MKKISLLALLALAALPAFAAAEKSPAQKPNIIFILSDDVGLGNVHCTGGHFNTPNIDSLAQGGTRFEYAYATPLCGPTRCLFLTGRYPFRTGLISNQSAGALEDHKEIMIPTVMKKAGYATACVGKWGQLPYGPGRWGFDEVMSCKGSGRYRHEQGIEYERNGAWKKLQKGEYLPDLMHDFIVSFIEKNKAKPFFLYYPIEAIHGPILRTPDSKKDESPARLYTDNVEYMDKLVGKLIAELDRLKLRENTLVIFSGDNGTASFGVEAAKVDGKAISGHKARLLEGGSRVPLVVNWPGTTPAGKVLKDLTDFSDFFGTFAELGGAQLPQGVQIDSHSFAAQIKGEKGTPRDWVYVELGGKSYARDARYKLTNKGALLDLKNAPFEEIPVAADTADAGALAAKKKLQAVLNEHPAGDASGIVKKNKKATKAGRQQSRRGVGKSEGLR
ncbi:MAG: sulfatase-like hydrolase/transferase [Kiritimatiellaeota bacterium]|nr:sulfatase-like hydrolase/transferase [Kiritimatiellota bacterium]